MDAYDIKLNLNPFFLGVHVGCIQQPISAYKIYSNP